MFCSVAVMSYVVVVFTRLYGLGDPLEILQQCFFFKYFFSILAVHQKKFDCLLKGQMNQKFDIFYFSSILVKYV